MEQADLHSQFSEGRAQLAYGLGHDGRLRHISVVKSGLACGCTCPACGASLVAKFPREIARHFAHLGETSCTTGPETALHYLAKEALEAYKRLLVPSVEALSGNIKEVAYPTREMTFDRVEVERRLDGVTPDIIVYYGSRELVVEIRVTHPSGPEKIERLRQMDLPAVEIDLRRLSRSATPDEIAQAVISTAPREWLYNAKLDAAQQRADAKALAAKQEEDRKLDEEARAFGRRCDLLLNKRFADASALSAAVRVVSDLGFEEFVSFPVSPERAFRVRSKDWQSVLFKHYVLAAKSGWERFSEAEAVGYLLRWKIVDALFEQPVQWELALRLRKLRPDLVTPQDAIKAYLGFLARRGVLERDDGLWSVSLKFRRAVEAAQRAVARREQERAYAVQRADSLRRQVESILYHLDPVARSAFDLEAWINTRQLEFDGTPGELANTGGVGWDRLTAALRAVERAFRLDDDPPALLGLPVLPHIQAAAARRAEERKQARLAAEASEAEMRQGREACFVSAAQSYLGADAEAWIEGAYKEGKKSRRVLCQISDENLTWFTTELERERRRRNDQQQKQAEATRLQAVFMEKATSRLGHERADLLLRTLNPRVGGRPIDILVDARGLERCIALIPEKGMGSRR